ncbi:hypothetical protein AB0D24_04650 [Streptomyces javensis]|uniref:hypothetical protein n=1 Tax=Streptomyces javensis TaxID=114698 RepID=UPI0033E57E30
MTGHSAAPPGPGAVLAPGPAREEWCLACKAWTRAAGVVLLLTPEGVTRAGTWAWCDTCDPTDWRLDHGR